MFKKREILCNSKCHPKNYCTNKQIIVCKNNNSLIILNKNCNNNNLIILINLHKKKMNIYILYYNLERV